MVIVIQGMHELFPLIVLHGRDEAYSRPTAPVARHGQLLCGVDGQAQGTWCGLNCETGRAVFLTNFRTQDLPGPPLLSRGALVMSMLEGKEPEERGKYGLCNVAICNLFDPSAPVAFERNADGVARSVLPPGQVHAFSNSAKCDDVSWPKVRWLRDAATRAMDELKDERDELRVRERLAQLLCNSECHEFAAGDRPEQELEALLRSRVLLHMPGYGTRAHTCAIGRADGGVTYAVRAVDEATGVPHSSWTEWHIRAGEMK